MNNGTKEKEGKGGRAHHESCGRRCVEELLLSSNEEESIMACLEVKKRRGGRVKGGRVIQLPCLEVF